jgi:hypothetical protein
MKTRITTVAATAVAALAVATGALAAPHQGNVRGWDANRPATVKPWLVKANPMGIRLVKPNPWASRGLKAW